MTVTVYVNDVVIPEEEIDNLHLMNADLIELLDRVRNRINQTKRNNPQHSSHRFS